MAERIVLLGWAGRALELDSDDAGALDSSVLVSTSFTKWGGPLANATVLHPHKRALGVVLANATRENYEAAWKTITRLCPHAREFTVEVPIPVGAPRAPLGPIEPD